MGRQQSLQPFLLALLFSLVVIHAAAEVQSASSRRPSAIEAAAEHPRVTPKKLRALDTSFSRKVAAALASEGSEGQAQVGVAALPADAADEWVESLTTKKKPTMGEWFKQLVEEIDEEYAAQEKEYQAAKHRSSREPHYADSPYTEPHDDYSSSPSYEQYGRKGDKEEPQEGQHGPDFWLFEEHHPEEYSHSKPGSEPRYSDSPDYKPSYEPEHKTPGYGGPEYTPTHDDSYYDKHGHEGTGREQYGRGPEHEQYGPGPEHEPYRRQYEEEHEPEQYKGEEQYGPEHPHPHKESEDVCVQEVARSNCVISDSAVTYTSSLGCCHAPYGERYYAEDKYPGEPDYPAYSALMIQRRNSAEVQQAVLHATARKPAGSSSGRSNNRGSAGSMMTLSKTMTSSPRTAVGARTAFASPHVFYPVGGKAECAWSLAYHDAVVVDEHTKQIGIASATCHFNGSMDHCGSPLCEGMTITISADVYSTYAVSKYAPSLTASDPSCRGLYDQRLGKSTLGGGAKFLPTTSPLDRPTGSPSLTDTVSRGLAGGQQQQRPGASSRSVGDMLGHNSAPAAGGSSSGGMMNPVSSRSSSGSSVSDMLGRSKQQPGAAHPPAAATGPSPRSVSDFLGAGKPPQMPHGSGASGIRSHIGMGSSGSGSGGIRSHIGSGGVGGSSGSGIRSHMGLGGGSSAGSKLPHNQRHHRGGHGTESQPEEPAAQPQPAIIPQEPAPEQAKEVPAATQPAPAAVPATPAPSAVPATPAPQPTPEAKAPQEAKPIVEAPAAPAPAATPVAAAPQQQPAPEKKTAEAKREESKPAPAKAAEPKDSKPAPAKAAEPKPLEQKPVAKEPQPAAAQPAWAAKVPEPTKTVPAWFAAVPEPRAGGPTQVRLQSAAAAPAETLLPLGPPAAKAADTWGAKVPEPSASSAPAWFAAVPEPKKAAGAAKQLLESGVRVASVNGPFLTYGEQRHEPAGGYRAEEERRSYAEEPHRGPGYAEEEEEHDKPYYDGPGAAPRYGEPQKPYYDGPGAAPRYGESEKPYYDGPGARYGYPEEPYHTKKPYSDDVDSIAEYIEADVGLYGGEAIVIAGVVTSVKGLPRGVHYTKGMVEHVAAFNGVSLSKKAYEALPYDTPHVKAGAYKVVFFEEDYADRYIP